MYFTLCIFHSNSLVTNQRPKYLDINICKPIENCIIMFLPLFMMVLTFPSFGQAIIGGKEVKDPRKYPWIVGLFKIETEGSTKYTLNCGGSIISENVILTAGHCVEDVLLYTIPH